MNNNIVLQKPIFNINNLSIGQLVLFRTNGGEYRPAILVDKDESFIRLSYYKYNGKEPTIADISIEDYIDSSDWLMFLNYEDINNYANALLNNTHLEDEVYIVTGYDNQDTDILGVYANKDMAEKRQKNEQIKIEQDNDPDWYTFIHCNKHKVIK